MNIQVELINLLTQLFTLALFSIYCKYIKWIEIILFIHALRRWMSQLCYLQKKMQIACIKNCCYKSIAFASDGKCVMIISNWSSDTYTITVNNTQGVDAMLVNNLSQIQSNTDTHTCKQSSPSLASLSVLRH